MKKILLTALLGTAIVSSNAQYFQNYKNLNFIIPAVTPERYNSGVKAVVDLKLGNPNNYYLAGVGVSYRNTTLFPVGGPANYKGDRMRFTRDYRNGTVATNKGYEVSDLGALIVHSSEGNSIAEQTNVALTGSYYIVGSVYNAIAAGVIPGGSDASWFNVGTSGIINSASRLDFNTGWTDRGMCVRESKFVPGTTIECGYTSQPGTTRTDCYVARRTNTGAILWAFTYNFDPTVLPGFFPDADCRSFSLCEDPLTGNIYCVGSIDDRSTPIPQQDALAFSLSPFGGVLWSNMYNVGKFDKFNSVKWTADNNLIVIGEVDPMIATLPASNTWLIKLFSATGAVNFSQVIGIPTALAPVTIMPSRGWDLIERINTFGLQEYQIVGTVNFSAIGDQLWIKADAAGVAKEFNVYNALGFDNFMGIDYANNGISKPGPVMFSSSLNTTSTSSNSHLIHSYFNGAACTNICPQIPISMALPVNFITLPFYVNQVRNSVGIKAKLFNYQVVLQCSQAAIGCGSSARDNYSTLKLDADDVNLYPNPVADQLNLNINANEQGEYQIEIMDITGKLIQTDLSLLAAGESEVQLDVSGLTPGFYMLRITNSSGTIIKKFIKN